MTTKAKMVTTDQEIDAALLRARELEDEVLATAIRYDSRTDLFFMDLSDGTRLVLQREKLQGLEHATKGQLTEVTVNELGTAINWPQLDTGFYVPSLIQGYYGTKKWMKKIAPLGGRVKSEAKSIAARSNGLKGGRPRRQLSTQVPR